MRKVMDDLKDSVNSCVKELGGLSAKLDVESSDVYANWLAQTYYFVCHSTRLLALAAGRFPLIQNEFHNRYAEHIKEEKGHEKLALRDLTNLGYNIKDFPEFSLTKAFYQTQYYQIEHISPISFWGYILCLEGFAVSGGVDIYDRALKAFGEKTVSFLLIHTREDVGHLEQAYEVLAKMSDEDCLKITENLRLSADLYAKIYSALIENNKSSSQFKAA